MSKTLWSGDNPFDRPVLAGGYCCCGSGGHLYVHGGLERGGVEDVEMVEVLVAEGDGDEGGASRVDAPQN